MLLLDVFPRGPKPDAQRQKNAEASLFAARALAADDGVVRLDLGPKFLAADGTLAKDVMPDFLHLSEAAYRVWAQAMVDEVDRLLQ